MNNLLLIIITHHNQLLFADDTALVADSEEKLCRVSLVEYAKEESLE